MKKDIEKVRTGTWKDEHFLLIKRIYGLIDTIKEMAKKDILFFCLGWVIGMIMGLSLFIIFYLRNEIKNCVSFIL